MKSIIHKLYLIIFVAMFVFSNSACQMLGSILGSNEGYRDEQSQAGNQQNQAQPDIQDPDAAQPNDQDPAAANQNVPDPDLDDPVVADPVIQNPELEQDFGEFSVPGIWESQVDTGNGIVSTQLLLEPTGTFSQVVTWGDLMTYDVGFFEVGDGFIHFSVTDHEPKEYQGQDLTWVNSFTYFITPIDPNTMVVEDHIMNTQWTMYRTGP